MKNFKRIYFAKCCFESFSKFYIVNFANTLDYFHCDSFVKCVTIGAMEFIRATEEDLTEIIRIFLSCWHIAYVDVLAEEVRTAMDEKAARALWVTSFENSDRDTFLVKDGNSTVAVFRTGVDPDD